MATTRREFLKITLGTAAGSAALTVVAPLTSRASLFSPRAQGDERVLVVLQLSGGNDGLNTVVPHAHDPYYRARPVLAVRTEQTLKLDDQVGLNPQLRSVHELFERGMVAVVQGVGYPHPDRSHFRSMDIWHTGAPEGPLPRTGWIGRVADRLGPGPNGACVLRVGAGQPLLALVSEQTPTGELTRLEDWQLRVAGDLKSKMDDLLALPRGTATSAQRLADQFRSASRQAERFAAMRAAANRASYPDTELGDHLHTVSKLLAGGFGARVFQIEMAGFDTHAQQRAGHDALLKQLGDALDAFFKDLGDRSRQVCVLVFSEFGRRVQENGSRGTDHGAAAPVLLVSGGLKGGLYGSHPSFADLDDGDLKFGTDFRRVYATVVGGWLGLDATAVLGEAFEPLPIV